MSIENPKEYTDNIKNLFNWVQNHYIKSILFLDTKSKHFQNKNLKICLPYNKSHMPETHMQGLNRENDKTLRGIKDVSTCLWFGKLNIVKISISPNLVHRFQSNFYQNPNRFFLCLVEIDTLIVKFV